MSADNTRTGELPWTGQRYVPEIPGDIKLEHLHRYAIARDLAHGKDVLDIACGEGYGSELLATVARTVTGVDISEEKIAHAARKYVRPNIAFAVGSGACIPLADASVDLVVSFETIEHHDRHLEMMQEIRRVLRPAGVLIISSPDKHEYSDAPGYKGEYHVKELFPSTFADLVSTQFRYVSVLGQRVLSASFVAPTDGRVARFMSYRRSGKTVQCEPGIIRPIYYIALASNATLPEIQGGLYEDGSHLYSQMTGRDEHIANRAWVVGDRNQQIDRIHQALAERDRLRQALQAVFNSTSWKVSAPLRWLGRLGDRLGRYHRSDECRMRLQSHRHIKSADGVFEITGRAPAFLLKTNGAPMPSGWCLLAFRVEEATTTLAPALYIDSGNGFSDATALALPPVREGWVRQLILLPPDVKALRLDPTIGLARFRLDAVTLREIGKLQVLLLLISCSRRHWNETVGCLRKCGWTETKRMLVNRVLAKRPLKSYETWVAMYDTLHQEDRAAIRADTDALRYKPLLSVVMPVYNTPREFLRQAIDSVLGQLYAHWELCIADDCSPDPGILRILATYQRKDPRIKVVRRDRNGEIAAASNSALALATGEFVALMDHDDILPAHALYMVAVELNRYPEADIVYSDEDRIDGSNIRYGAYFKSDWNPDLMRGQNMINHLGVYRRSLLASIGGFRFGYEGSQDYDLALRAVERTTPERIRHIPHILYHWRVFSQSGSVSGSNLPRATRAARQAVQDHLDRLGTGATVGPAPGLESYSRVIYPLPAVPPPVTLIVPTRDKVELLSQCVSSLIERTDYPDFDVIIVDNGSCEAETLAYFASLAGKSPVKILAFDREFNYSAINNFAIGQARGNVIGLVNNDTRVIEPGWLKEMVSHALRPEVGAVGAKLLYPDDRVQHAGVVTGIHGVANHAHRFCARDDVGYFGRLVLTQEYSCVTAACLVMRKAVYEEVGGLDETNLKVSFNDVDLCLRIRNKRYLVVWTPNAELYHMESASRGRDTHPEQAERARNEVRYLKTRWGESLLCDPYYNPNLSLDDVNVNFTLAFPPRAQKPWLQQKQNQPRLSRDNIHIAGSRYA